MLKDKSNFNKALKYLYDQGFLYTDKEVYFTNDELAKMKKYISFYYCYPGRISTYQDFVSLYKMKKCNRRKKYIKKMFSFPFEKNDLLEIE